VIRYADDFVVTGISKEILQTQVRPAIETFLAERGLEPSPTKTSITHVEEGFDFLGQNIRKYDGKLLIKPAKKSIKSLLEKVHELLKRHAASPQQLVIVSLNRVVRGWAMYHRHVVSKECFAGIDARIWRMLWRWAQKRHPNKAQGWILTRYFHRLGRKTWAFVTKIETNAGSTYWQLFQASSVAIRRHVKINSLANPFDPQWDAYFDKREHDKVFR
jgi:RNA-directed DNA polymerase